MKEPHATEEKSQQVQEAGSQEADAQDQTSTGRAQESTFQAFY